MVSVRFEPKTNDLFFWHSICLSYNVMHFSLIWFQPNDCHNCFWSLRECVNCYTNRMNKTQLNSTQLNSLYIIRLSLDCDSTQTYSFTIKLLNRDSKLLIHKKVQIVINNTNIELKVSHFMFFIIEWLFLFKSNELVIR
jgi:hypothetical protein